VVVFIWREQLPPRPGAAEFGVDRGFTGRGADPSVAGGADRAATQPYAGFNLGAHVGDDLDRVEANRASLAEAVGVTRDRLVFMHQCHGIDVEVVDGPWSGAAPPADGLVTGRTDLALAVLVADCTPVLLADPAAGVVAAVHAGRPGMVGGIIGRAVDAMHDLGATRIRATVGPSVCGRCYEVPEDMRARAAATSAVSATVSWQGTPAIDVAAGVVDQLRARDVTVDWVPGCTRESSDLYSYRRDPVTGRFAGVIRLVAPQVGHR
jgi:YfiH family protein